MICLLAFLSVIIESGKTCTHRHFLSEETVRSQALMMSHIKARDLTQTMYPDMHFSCTGLITKWIISGELGMSKYSSPELQLWRTTDGINYFKTGFSLISTLLRNTSYVNVYEHIVDPPMEFQNGDVFGLYKPKHNASVLNIYLQENGGPIEYGLETGANSPLSRIMADSTMLLDQNDYPMVSVEISTISKSCYFLINFFACLVMGTCMCLHVCSRGSGGVKEIC